MPRLADRARAETWSHEEFLVACLQREVAAREAHGGEGRIRAARFPARESLEEFDFDHARGLKRELIAHLGTLDFVTSRDNVVFLGPPGTGKTPSGLVAPPGKSSPGQPRLPVDRTSRRQPVAAGGQIPETGSSLVLVVMWPDDAAAIDAGWLPAGGLI